MKKGIKDAQSGFSLEISQNPYLYSGDAEMHAILMISGHGLESVTGGSAPEAAEVILVDCSSSMAWPPTKIVAARRAAAAAIDTLRDGVFFAVVEGTSRARTVYPPAPPLAVATSQTKAEAKAVVVRLIASGGTAIGTWLAQAGELFDAHPAAVRHALLLTDGKNETEPPDQLARVLDACAGRFVCDARGIGEGWEPRELLRIVTALNGQDADAVREDADLEADFRSMMQAAMRKVVPDLRIRFRLVPGNRLRFIKQVYPLELNLTTHGIEIDEYTTEFSTGSWAEENREYHVCIEVVPDGPKFEDVQLAQVEVAAVIDQTDVGAPDRPVPIVVHRTDDPVLSTRLNPKVDHYTIQDELSRAMMAGCDAYDAGDLETARVQWGHAVELATAAGNEERLTRLKRLIDVDPVHGVIRIKENLQRRDIHSVVMGSSILFRSPNPTGAGQPGDHRPTGPDRTCPKCRRVVPANSVCCMKCGQLLGGDDELAAGLAP